MFSIVSLLFSIDSFVSKLFNGYNFSLTLSIPNACLVYFILYSINGVSSRLSLDLTISLCHTPDIIPSETTNIAITNNDAIIGFILDFKILIDTIIEEKTATIAIAI